MSIGEKAAVGGTLAVVVALAVLPVVAGGFVGYHLAKRKAWGAVAGAGAVVLAGRLINS